MTGSSKRFTGILGAMALGCLALFLVGCDGDDGRDGLPGAPGEPGADGQPGPPGGGIEDGAAVTIGSGADLSEETIARIGGLVAAIDSVSISSPPVVEFTVTTIHGGPAEGIDPGNIWFTLAKLVPAADGKPSYWQSYINRLETPSGDSTPNVLDSALQATTETGSTGSMQELGGGKYRYTFATDPASVTEPVAIEYDPTAPTRVGLEIRLDGEAEPLAPDNPVADIIPETEEEIPPVKAIAATENCADCHVRFAMHGGPRRTVEYCVTCHNPGTIDQDTGESLDMAYMAHSIHLGESRADYSTEPPTIIPYVIYGFMDFVHDYSEVTYPQSPLFCENCHEASDATPDGDAWMASSSTTACGGCHAAGLEASDPDPVTGQPTYVYNHLSAGFPATDGLCVNCHVEGGVAGATAANHFRGAKLEKALGDNFIFEILDVTNVGEGLVPEITIKVSDAEGNAYDILTDPAFDEDNGASLNLYLGWDTGDITNALADGTLITTGNECRTPDDIRDQERGYPLRMRVGCIQPNAVANEDGSYTVTFYRALPAVTGNVMVVMDGHPVAIPEGGSEYIETTPVNTYWPPDDAPGARARLVSMEKCDACHARLAIHGGNRNGDPQGCLVCHNSSAAFSDDEAIGGTVAMGAFIHNLHIGKVPDFAGITYPQSIGNCDACHLEGSYYGAREGAVAISIGPGASEATVTDDLWSSATAGTCATCHSSGPAKAHMEQNGGALEVDGGKTLTPSSSFEACIVCHGPGRSADVAEAHGGGAH